jgi:hypothetical protein
MMLKYSVSTGDLVSLRPGDFIARPATPFLTASERPDIVVGVRWPLENPNEAATLGSALAWIDGMPKHINSASRLFAIARDVAGMRDDLPVPAMWADIFQVPPEAQGPIEICRRLLWLDEEITAFVTQMRGTHLSEHLYLEVATGLRKAGSPTQINGTAQAVKRHSPESLRRSLEVFADVLPDEEAQIDTEQMNLLEELMAQLRELIETAELTPTLANVVRHHIDLLQRALQALPIKGVHALIEAARAAAGEVDFFTRRAESDDVETAPAERAVASRLHATWSKVTSIIDSTDKVRKALSLGYDAYRVIERLL